MLIYVEPKFPRSFAIDMDKLAESVCRETGIRCAEEISTDLGWDYIECQWKNWLMVAYPWFKIVDEEENKELYQHLLESFKKHIRQENL